MGPEISFQIYYTVDPFPQASSEIQTRPGRPIMRSVRTFTSISIFNSLILAQTCSSCCGEHFGRDIEYRPSAITMLTTPAATRPPSRPADAARENDWR